MIAGIVKPVNLASLSSRSDYSYETVNLVIWMAVEEYMIIMGACIPTLTPLFNIAVQKRSTSKGTKSNPYGASNPKVSHRHTFRSTGYSQFESDSPEYPLREYHGDAWAAASSKPSERDSDEVEQGIGIMKTTEVQVHAEDEAR